jgi:hypothetical protein
VGPKEIAIMAVSRRIRRSASPRTSLSLMRSESSCIGRDKIWQFGIEHSDLLRSRRIAPSPRKKISGTPAPKGLADVIPQRRIVQGFHIEYDEIDIFWHSGDPAGDIIIGNQHQKGSIPEILQHLRYFRMILSGIGDHHRSQYDSHTFSIIRRNPQVLIMPEAQRYSG